jgi:hypothetical protein
VTALAAALLVAMFSGTGCAPTGIGDPCVPEQEYDPQFLGFDYHEVSTESKSFQCITRLCLVNHFQGRVSCPYGQGPDGAPLGGSASYPSCSNNPISNQAPGCCTPGIRQPVTGPLVNGKPADTSPNGMQSVQPQCNKRTSSQAVYCSCRCANINGATDDGAVYCACPDGYACTQLVTAIQSGMMATNEGLTGAYCVKNGTQFDANKFTCTSCSDALNDCGKKDQLY